MMPEASPLSFNSSAVLSEVVAAYGKLKRIRYLVNSTPDFHEILFAVNQIVGAVGSAAEAEKIMRLAAFNAVPLPNSQSRFLACFDIPERLLGEARSRTVQLPDYSLLTLPEGALQIQRQYSQTIYKYRAASLFDVNQAICHFKGAKSGSTPPAAGQKRFRAFDVSVIPRESTGNCVDLAIIVNQSPVAQQPA